MIPIKSKYKSDFVGSSISNFSAFSCNKIPINLWHYRLGHPSLERFLLLKQFYPILKSDKQFACEICHHSKQKRLSFPSSESHSFCVFALIHVDI